ncbi:hypothetical protein C7I84_06375 [Mesorhizobium ephedrae]|uniref:ATP-binding protein n=2 Tax=Kumtagia ephedrae TaxID=2116701 RepID=A0A2P7SLM1_9HYPH|nr:hypothetical protein C7I84_06375 [Mesorhizobium ephedrae]
MAIKKDALHAFFQARPEQEALAAALDEVFDVTYGSYQFGQAFWLCQPKPLAVERFGLQREVIALYSPHGRADVRLLTALENISRAPEFRHRVENVVAFVIYEGDKASIESLAGQSKDWVIVALSANELKDKGGQIFLIRSRMAATIGRFDLFGMSSPIKHDKYFYGRDMIVQELVQRALIRKEQSGLFGLRKTGKTSVLFAIQRRLSEKGAIAEYVDCQSPGIYGSRWWAVLEELSRRMLEFAAKAGCPAPAEFSFDMAGAANSFIRTVKWIHDKSEVGQIVLLLDEVEFITPGITNHLGQHWDDDHLPLWQTIRSASQETKGFLTFCVAGVNPSSVEQSHFNQVPNPIFQLAVPFYLDQLTRPNVREMVRAIAKYAGAALDEDCFDLLSEEYGGHPYLIRLACSEVLRSLGELPVDKKAKISKANFESVKDKIATRLAQPIKDIMLSLVWWYPDEYDLLCLLADGDTAFVKEFLASEPEKASRFARYGLLKADNGSFAIKELRTFLARSGLEYKKAISPFTRGDLPLEYLPIEPNIADLAALFERRTEVEYALRKLLITVLEYRFAFDGAKVANAISEALPKKNGDRAQLFIGRLPKDAVNELYLSDLKPVFVKNWDNFSAYFGSKSDRFEMNLDTINIARRYEAHTKPVSAKDLDDFQNSYSWLTTRLSKVPGLISGSMSAKPS